MNNHNGNVATRGRIIMFPLPVPGHMNPMFQLGEILHTQGFKITIIHCQKNTPNYSDYPRFTFKPIDDKNSEIGKHMPAKPEPSFFIDYLNQSCVDSVTECLTGLLAEPNEPPVACLITSTEYYFTQEIADSLNIPRLNNWACNYIGFLVYDDLQYFYEKGYFNLTPKDPEYHALVPEYPCLKVRDIIKTAPNPYGLAKLYTKVMKQVKASSGIIWCSFKETEEDILESFNNKIPIQKFILGPLQYYLPSNASNVFEQYRTLFSWLDAQAPTSVIYVSFGSVSSITKAEFQEIAYGLANIGFPVLWVIRAGLVKGLELNDKWAEKFLEEVGGTGHVVNWCPQKEVLAHKAIGCHWTHSGWNSTLESICEGVPMICTPCLVAQPIIARYVNDVWKIGVLLEDGLERHAIETVVKRVMVDEEGKEIRKRINLFKEKLKTSFDQGGSSHESLNKLVDYISSFTK